ncbi:MAG: DJ-1/PfpI family protein [SAR324 cluster bacterium]
MTLHVGLLLFPELTQLDLTGPYEVFARMPDTQVHLVAEHSSPVRSDQGLTLVPTGTFASVPALDLVCVPGGTGIVHAIESAATLAFLRSQAETARYVTSVCTGALVLGAAGLLRGYRATTHWMSLDLLPLLGAIPVPDRIVMDRNRVTCGGVTAGIDFALRVAAELFSPAVAEGIQLTIEYDPEPPFRAGSPRTAPAEVVARAVERGRARQDARRHVLLEAARKAGLP